MLKKDSQNLWEDKMKAIFDDKPPEEIDLFLNLVSISIYGRENDDMSNLYHHMGLEEFSKIVSLFSGRVIEFPTRKNFRDNVLIALTFFMKEIQGKTWEDIKTELPFEDVNSIKYGKGINKLKKLMEDSQRGLMSNLGRITDGEK